MKLQQLTFASTLTQPPGTRVFRVQRSRTRGGCVAFGRHLRVAPAGLMFGRFDLHAQPVGYFSAETETAVYETMVRRSAEAVPLSELQTRSLVELRMTAPLKLLDLRQLAHEWPFVQSPRYEHTTELAEDASREGFDGVVYLSAQQHAAACFAIFGPALPALRSIKKEPLVNESGALHIAVARAITGAQAKLVP